MKFMQIKPQKARGKLREELWDSPDWVVEEKYDGDRRIAQFMAGLSVGHELVRFTGCRESVDGSGFVEKSACIPHLSNVVGAKRLASAYVYCAPPRSLVGTVLDGEIVAPELPGMCGGRSKYVTSVMGSSPNEAIRKQRERGRLCYVVFDCLWFKGEDARDLNLMQRQGLAMRAVHDWNNEHVWCALSVRTEKLTRYKEILKAGGEGVVLKRVAAPYGDESAWVKVKGEWTADVVVMGHEPGKGKYKGQVGSIVFGQYQEMSLRPGAVNAVGVVPFGTCSGFDDRQRAEMTAHPARYIGRVLEIKHSGREPTGAFRHPRFSRWRPDKAAQDCVRREDET